MLTHYMCDRCGAQHQASLTPPKVCKLCNDERQPQREGSAWTTHEELLKKHRNTIKRIEPDLIGIGTEPALSIGQRALLLLRDEGNILFDCIPLLDPTLIQLIQSLGGISAISVSHPHYYTNIIEWSHTFNHAPIYIHESDREWVCRPDEVIKFWSEEKKEISPGVTLINAGGHFPGALLLHDSKGAAGKGTLYTGDIIQVTPDPNMVGFMYSSPLYIPLSAKKVEHIMSLLEPHEFETLYGSFWPRVIENNAKEKVEFCARRHIDAINGKYD